MKMDIGIPEDKRKLIADGLAKLTADTYTLYLTTHYFHWNVTGPLFPTLHKMFEDQYVELWQAVDVLAERIRTLGFYAPGTYATLMRLSSIKQEEEVPKATRMLEVLVDGHECVIRNARALFVTADEANDEGTMDLLTQRMEIHEKTAWMIRSMLET